MPSDGHDSQVPQSRGRWENYGSTEQYPQQNHPHFAPNYWMMIICLVVGTVVVYFAW